MTDRDRFEATLAAGLQELADSARQPADLTLRLMQIPSTGPDRRAPIRRPVRGGRIALICAAAIVLLALVPFLGLRALAGRDTHTAGAAAVSTSAQSSPTTPGSSVALGTPVAAAVPAGPISVCGLPYATLPGVARHGLVSVDPNPSGATAVWYPGLNASPCRTELTPVDAATARQLAGDIDRAAPLPAVARNCPADSGGGVILYFTYAGQALAQQVFIGLRGCESISAPQRGQRDIGDVRTDLISIAPPVMKLPPASQ